MESWATIFPCGDSRCDYHAKVYHRKLAQRQKKVENRCLLTSSPPEILQQIAVHLDLISRASFAVSHAIICDAIGTGPWELFQRPEYSKIRAEFVDLLLSDYVDEDCCGSRWCECVIPCQQCALVHNIKSNGANEPSITRALLTDDAATFDFCNGAYCIPQRWVKLALERSSARNWCGICTAFLRCSGSRKLDIPSTKNNPEQEPDRAELLISYQQLDEKPKESKRASRPNHSHLSPSGGNLRTRARRFRSRLFETRADIQGRGWSFYFPMTLLFFIPGSRPFRVRQKLKKSDVVHRTGPESEQAGTPSHDSSVGADDNFIPEDGTGWTQYYEELEVREALDTHRTSYVEYLYEGKSGKTPWYDRPCVAAFLDIWGRIIRMRYVFKIQLCQCDSEGTGRRPLSDGESGDNGDAQSVDMEAANEECDSIDDLEEIEGTCSHDGVDDEFSDVDGNDNTISTSCKWSRRGRRKKRRILLNEVSM